MDKNFRIGALHPLRFSPLLYYLARFSTLLNAVLTGRRLNKPSRPLVAAGSLLELMWTRRSGDRRRYARCGRDRRRRSLVIALSRDHYLDRISSRGRSDMPSRNSWKNCCERRFWGGFLRTIVPRSSSVSRWRVASMPLGSPDPIDRHPPVGLALPHHMSESRERKMISHRQESIGCNTIQDRPARLDRQNRVVVENRSPFRVLKAGDRVVDDIRHVQELLVLGGEENRCVCGRMAWRRNIVHAGCNFATLLHEAGSGGYRRKVILCGGHNALLERIGHRRFRHLCLELFTRPVIPLGVHEHESSLGEGGHAGLGNETADMVEVPMRHDHEIDAVGGNS